DPGKYLEQGGAGVLKGSRSAITEKDTPSGMLKNESDKSGGGPSEMEKKQMKEAALKIISQLEQQEAFHRLRDNVKMQLTSEGLRIILNESAESPAFFEPGSAKLLRQSAVILMTIAGELGHLQNRIVLEGHTDAAYTGDLLYTNWELSADRANAARELLEAHGLWDGQVREVRGFAEQFPMIADNPADARNRRVTIVVLYEHASMAYDQMEVGADLMALAEAQE
ncbi:MAG TPA: OmpA family protein, partial [candidate division Zixibacteria bacterium]|nr:OmpA family protein [candidate division Zixibacteria bacterium]